MTQAVTKAPKRHAMDATQEDSQTAGGAALVIMTRALEAFLFADLQKQLDPR